MSGEKVHAVAGIGNPERFFNALTQLGFQVIPHPLGDHHNYRGDELTFTDTHAVIMTEKDAVKCQTLAPENSWVLPVDAQPDDQADNALNELIHIAYQRFLRRSAVQ